MNKVCLPQQAQNLIIDHNQTPEIRPPDSLPISACNRNSPASGDLAPNQNSKFKIQKLIGVAQGSPASDHVPSVRCNGSTVQRINDRSGEFRLRRGHGFWQLTFTGQDAVLKHEQGLAYIAWLLLNPPEEPIHAVALALNARKMCGEPVDPAELIQQRSLGLDDAESLGFLRQHEEKLHAIVDDEHQIGPVKEEAIRELREIYEFMNKNPWRTRDNAQRCVRAVTMAIKRLHKNLAQATTLHRCPDLAVRAFADHIYHHIMVPSGRAGNHGGARRWLRIPGGCFTYDPPSGVHWTA